MIQQAGETMHLTAPDRIWIDGAVNVNVWAEQKTDCTLSGVAAHEYVRADLCDPTQDGRVKALVDAVKAMPQDWYDDNCDCKPCEALHAALRDLEQESKDG